MSFRDVCESAKLKGQSIKLDVEFAGLVAGVAVKDAVDSYKDKKVRKKQEVEDRNKKLFNEAVQHAVDNRKKILDKYIRSADYNWDEVIGINLIKSKKGDYLYDNYFPNYHVEVMTESDSFIIEIGFEGTFLVFYSLKMIFPVVDCEYITKRFNYSAENLGAEWYSNLKKDKYNSSKVCTDFVDYLVLESTNMNSMDDINKATDKARHCLRTSIDYWMDRENSVCSLEEHKLAMEINKLFSEANKNLTVIEEEKLYA